MPSGLLSGSLQSRQLDPKSHLHHPTFYANSLSTWRGKPEDREGGQREGTGPSQLSASGRTGPPDRIQASGPASSGYGTPGSRTSSGPGPRACAKPGARVPAIRGIGTRAWRRVQAAHPPWSVRPGAPASALQDHTKDPTPGRACISCSIGGGVQPPMCIPRRAGRAGRGARPHAAPVPARQPRGAALGGPAPMSPQAGLPLCAARAPRPRHWPAGPGGQPLPGSPHAYA